MRLTDMLRAKSKASPQEQTTKEVWKEEIHSLPIELIIPSPYQPRVEFEEAAIDELAASIKEHGVLHPVLVRKIPEGYELIVGERRLRACKRLGWESIPAIVKQLTDKAAAEMALIENLQRRDLDFFEEADGYKRLIEEFDLTQETLAQRIGKSQSSVANKLRLLRLNDEVRKVISREILTERHARALLKLESPEDQFKVAKEAAEKHLNVKETERLVERIKEKTKSKGKKGSKKIIFKDIRLFTNSLKELTTSLKTSGLDVDVNEEDGDEFYRVTVLVRKPDGRG